MNKSTGALFYNKDKNLEIMDFMLIQMVTVVLEDVFYFTSRKKFMPIFQISRIFSWAGYYAQVYYIRYTLPLMKKIRRFGKWAWIYGGYGVIMYTVWREEDK